MRLRSLVVTSASLMVVGGNGQQARAQYGVVEVPDRFSPRYYLGAYPGATLERRQSGDCGPGAHSCLDIGAAVCCLNSEYCLTVPTTTFNKTTSTNTTTYSPSCCALGSSCSQPCDEQHYLCPLTTTISGTATTTSTCCLRACTSTSAYKCASAYGGGCCSYDSSCATGATGQGICVSTVQSSSSAAAAIVTEVPSGCTTSQISCASGLGGGCCGIGLACTVVSNINYCANETGTAMATRTGGSNSAASSSGAGLSTGAKAGIAVGLAGGVLLILGVLLCFCVLKRRRMGRDEGQGQGQSEQPVMSQVSNSQAGAGGGGGKRQASDYFGPTASVGPYTETHSPTSPISPHSLSSGVPLHPQSPGDIAVPVEIDSRTTSNLPSPGTPADYYNMHSSPVELP